MEMVGLSAAFMLIFLPLTLPAWILAKQNRFLVTAAFFAAFVAILYFLAWLELLRQATASLVRVDEDDLGVIDRLDPECALVADGGAVARFDADAVHLDRSFRRHEIAVPRRSERVFDAVARFERCAENARLGPDRKSAGIAGKAARERDQPARTVGLGEGLGAPGRRAALAGRLDPDLEQRRGDGFPIVLSVANAGPCAHHLNVARLGAALVAEAVLMRDRARADIGDDLHVGMRVRGEAGMGRDLVVVPDAQGPVPHPLGVVIARERAMMLGLEPAMVGAAKRRERPLLDHGRFPLLQRSAYIAIWTRRFKGERGLVPAQTA